MELMKDIYAKVKKYILENKMIADKDVIVAGVSGGADSVCLLLLLWELSKEIDFRLFVVHVHHGVRTDADKDAEYVEKMCAGLEVPFFLKKVNMMAYAKEKGLSPEEAGRDLRYQAFEEVIVRAEEADQRFLSEIPDREGVLETQRKGIYKIAVAHNNNDRAETMLFHLFRGSGLRGIVGIRPVRGRIIRPLLCLERTEIEAYLKRRKVAFCIDSTNEEDAYTRNRIRHHILAYANEHICNNVTAHMGEASEILAEADDYIGRQTELAFRKCLLQHEEERMILDLYVFQKEDVFIQKMVLLCCMEEMTPCRKDIAKEHIYAIMDIMRKGGSKEVFLPYGLTAYKEYDKLIFGKRKIVQLQAEKSYQELSVSVPGEVMVPGLGILEFQIIQKDDIFYTKGQIIPQKTYTKWFDYDKITTVLLLRTRKTGDYLTIDNALRKKSVKEYMINEKIPKMQRERIYLLADGAHIVWIPGYRISQYYKVEESTKSILQVRLRGGG